MAPPPFQGTVLFPSPGVSLGPYQIVRRLGVGKIGEVYLARHVTLGREVAIKLLAPEAAGQPALVRRLFDEAKIVNEINHENIVEILDFVTEPGGPSYYGMEFLRGRDLARARAEQGPFTIERTLSIGLQICAALHATHRKGIVHRNLEPENVFLVERGGRADFVKIIDFGVAKIFGASRSGSFTVARHAVDARQLQFMSPEQAGGRSVDGRSDVYTLGVLLYWMLTDRLPFDEASFERLIVLRLTTPAEEFPETLPSGQALPRRLSAVVQRCLASRPVDRFQSVDELCLALSRVEVNFAARGATPPKASRSWSSTRRIPWAAGLAALGLSAAVAVAVSTGSFLRVKEAKAAPAAPIDAENLVVVPPPAPSVPALPPLPAPARRSPRQPNRPSRQTRVAKDTKDAAKRRPRPAAPVPSSPKAAVVPAPPTFVGGPRSVARGWIVDPFSQDALH